MALPILLIGFVKKQMIKKIGGFMFKRIMRFFIPKIIEVLTEGLRAWADDPKTKTDDKAIKAVGEYISYITLKWLA